MNRFTQINRTWLMAGAAVLVVLGAGGIYALTRTPSEPPADTHAEGAPADDHTAEAEGAHVTLTPAQIEAAGITIVGVTGGGGGETRLSGRVEPMIDARAAVATSVGGRVERVLVASGQSVRAGQPLAVLVSGDAASLRADVEAAAANAVAAQQAHRREESLADQGVVARRDAEVAHAEALSAEAAADAARARAYADSARMESEVLLRSIPDDAQSRLRLGVQLAILGRKTDAIREGEKAMSEAPADRDAYIGPYLQHLLVRIYILTGEPEKALDRLEPLLKIPYYLSPGWLRIDPAFDPIRKHPRFQRLVEGGR